MEPMSNASNQIARLEERVHAHGRDSDRLHERVTEFGRGMHETALALQLLESRLSTLEGDVTEMKGQVSAHTSEEVLYRNTRIMVIASIAIALISAITSLAVAFLT